MKDPYPLDHVALLVPSLEVALARLADIAPTPGPIQEFPGEGTREVYLGGPERSARLLLMQPLDGTGPYARALTRRGPGLHHLAFRLPDLDEFCRGVGAWLAIPRTLPDLNRTRTLWLARPGVGTLLEVHEGEPTPGEPVVRRVQVPSTTECAGALILSVQDRILAGVERSPDSITRLDLPGGQRTVTELTA